MAAFTGQNWDTLMKAHNAKWGQEVRRKMELNEIFNYVKVLLERKSNIHWHTVYLEKYIAESIVPFGLRRKLFPHFKKPSDSFKQKWENTLTGCSMAPMSLLVDEHKEDLKSIDVEIQPLISKISTLDNPEGIAIKEKEINEFLEKSSRELISKKEKKLFRDQNAFYFNKAYVWPSNQTSRNVRRISEVTQVITREKSCQLNKQIALEIIQPQIHHFLHILLFPPCLTGTQSFQKKNTGI